MKKNRVIGVLFLLAISTGMFGQTSLETFINFRSTAGGCADRSVVPCTAPDNRVFLTLIPHKAPDVYVAPPSATPTTVVPRFKAFWIPGDGNYWEFGDIHSSVAMDAESLAPSTSYNYAKAGVYTVSAYMTGKYTDRNPPPGAHRPITIPALPPVLPASSTPTSFQRRAGSGNYHFFPVHDLRKGYLTPFVLSYPATLDSTWGYLFYNGQPTGASWSGEPPLKYSKTEGEAPNYFNGDRTKIRSYATASLGETGIDDIFYKPEFLTLRSKYSNVLFFPLENVDGETVLPPGFVSKRYFPVFFADSSERISITGVNPHMSFCFVVTSNKPAAAAEQTTLDNFFRSLDWPLAAGTSINYATNDIERGRALTKMARTEQVASIPAQYIQGVYMDNIAYATAHDPNQLTILKVEKTGEDEFLVTFHLEMCNKGFGRTESQSINLFDRFGRFRDFKFNGNAVPESPTEAHHYSMTSGLVLEGIPAKGYEMMCGAIEFTAATNCDGIRSLWASNARQAFEVCVKFTEATDTECNDNEAIDTCSFKIEDQCVCVKEVPTCGGDGWFLAFLLIFVFVLLVWKYYSDKANNL